MATENNEVKFRTERLLIRPLRLEDAEDVLLMRSNPEVMKFTPSLSDADLQKTKDWVSSCITRSNCWNFSMELLPATPTTTPTSTEHPIPQVIGVIGAIRTPEVGYMINANYWNQGYASEALHAFMPLFFCHFSNEKLLNYAEAHVDPEHLPSRRVLEKAGFKLVEIRERDFESPTLGLRDTCIYQMARPEQEVKTTANTTQ